MIQVHLVIAERKKTVKGHRLFFRQEHFRNDDITFKGWVFLMMLVAFDDLYLDSNKTQEPT